MALQNRGQRRHQSVGRVNQLQESKITRAKAFLLNHETPHGGDVIPAGSRRNAGMNDTTQKETPFGGGGHCLANRCGVVIHNNACLGLYGF
jgi:hypothetical protein